MTTLGPRKNLRPSTRLRLPQFGQIPTQATRTTTGETLTTVVRNVARDVDDSTLRPVARRDSGPAYRPRLLLELLTCCYAREILGSTDIERLLRRDAAFRALCGDEYPDARTLRVFRRQNRAALQECLESALQFLQGRPEHQGGFSLEITCSAEALRRLDMAACMDTLELD